MIRPMTRILVVPVLGGLLAPTKLPRPATVRAARPRRTRNRRRASAWRVQDPHSRPSQGAGAGTAQLPGARHARATAPVSDRAGIAAAVRNGRRRPRALFSIGAVGVALVVAGCGSATGNSAGSAAAGAHTTPVAPANAVTTPAAAPAKAPATPKPTTTPTAPAKAPGAATTQTPATTPKAPAAAGTKNPDAGIPQGGGGDGDPDNSGGPNDGDGPI
jgi:hypothetical protein